MFKINVNLTLNKKSTWQLITEVVLMIYIVISILSAIWCPRHFSKSYPPNVGTSSAFISHLNLYRNALLGA
jgi:hypothetical protein